MENIGLIYRKKESFTGFDGVNDLLDPKLKKKIRLTILGVHFGLLAILLLWYLIANFFISKKPSVIQVTLVSPPNETFTPPQPTRKPTPVAKKKKRQVKPKKKTPPKPKPKPKPKKKRYLDPNQIKISKKEVKHENIDDLEPISAEDLQKELNKKFQKYKFKPKNTQGNRPPGNISQNYFDQVSAVIYQTWQQPGKSEIGNRLPTVDVDITVDGNGRVTKARISRKSGIAPMDISAARLLKNLRTLPRPPNGRMTFTVTLEIIRN